MKRLMIFVGCVVLLFLLGYPFYKELNQLREVKEAKQQFQSTTEDSERNSIDIRAGRSHWNELPEHLRTKLSEMGLFPAKLPDKLTSFKLRDLDNDVHRLEDYRGEWVLINFWATWCPPCRMEMPSLRRLQKKFNEKNFQVLAINVQEPASVARPFKKEYELNFPVLLDKTGEVSEQYQLTGVPETWLIAPNGEPMAKINGPIQWDDQTARSFFSGITKRQHFSPK